MAGDGGNAITLAEGALSAWGHAARWRAGPSGSDGVSATK